MLFAQFHTNTPVNLNSVSNLYWAPWRFGLQMQYQVFNAATLGLLDDVTEELEHALVEGKDITESFVEDIVALQQSTFSAAQKQAIAQTTLDNAENQLKHIASDLVQNVMLMPWMRLLGRPARKRFPVTLEGQAVEEKA